MTGRLAGKIAFVTGAASPRGLGGTTVARFAEEGAIVYATDLDLDALEKTAADIRASGGQVITLRHDVTNEAEWDDVFAAIERDHGTLDIMINNAGIAVLRMIGDFTTADWNKQLDVNLNSVFYGTKRAVASMRKGGRGGAIVNVSSIAGMVGVPACSAYAAAKAGVRVFSKTVAIECAAENIRVNTVHPGMIDTDMQNVAKRDNTDAFYEIVAGIPMKRMGEPIDIANANLFLCSDEGRYITGAELVIDGGVTAQ